MQVEPVCHEKIEDNAILGLSDWLLLCHIQKVFCTLLHFGY